MANPRLFTPIAPTTEIEAVNIMLSTIGESPINSFEEVTSDVAIARSTLQEISKAVQLEGWQWNTEDNFPLQPDMNTHKIKVEPTIVRVWFPHPFMQELVIRGGYVYDRNRHTFAFENDFRINVSILRILPFDALPETAKRYISIRASRVFQERVVGSSTLTSFTSQDEIRARSILLDEEHRLNRPNILKGELPSTGTWNPIYTLLNRGGRHYG